MVWHLSSRAGRAVVLAAVIAMLLGSGPVWAHCAGQPCPVATRSGFSPMRIPGGGTSRSGHVVFADLGLTPGRKSLVFGTSNGRLYVVKHDGTVAAGFPVTLPREIVSSPAVGTLTLANGSKVTAIVIGYGSNFSGQVDAGGLRAYTTGGTLLSRIGTFSNRDATSLGSYAQRSFSLASWRGQTVRVQFRVTTDSTLATSFRVDDVSLR